MIESILVTHETLESVLEKYTDEDRGFRALAYFIHTAFAKENGFNFRQRINHLKWVRGKLSNAG